MCQSLTLAKDIQFAMHQAPARFKPQYHEPQRNDQCVCGSGLKFKKCCGGSYSSKAANQFRTAFNQGNYEDALVHARRHFTWYVLCHKAHTVPLLQVDERAGQELLQIDIEALEELLENLHRCYYHLGRGAEFLEVINKVRETVDDPRWRLKVTYIEGLWYLVDQDDETTAFDVLKQIDIDSCTDEGVLSLYLQVCPTELPLPVALSIIDRIITNTSKESVKLQYRVLKAVKYLLICQHKEADQIFEDAFARFMALPQEKRSSYGRMHFAYALEIYGKAGHRVDALEQAKSETIALVSYAQENKYSEKHIADLLRLLGDCQAALGQHAAASESYTQSFAKHPSPLTKVFLARAEANRGSIDAARLHLLELDECGLDDPGRFDCAISWALLAAISLRIDDIQTAKVKLKAIDAQAPAFIHLRDSWMINLLEMKPVQQRNNIRDLICKLNDWVLLKPSVFGMGINLNKVIEDIDSAIQKNKS
jgi:tetratricopeptide (TPR) repeat protein